MTLLLKAPAPQTKEQAGTQKKWIWNIRCCLVLASIVALLILISSYVTTASGYALGNERVNNAYMLGIALCEFEHAYGKFPDPSTVAIVRSKTGSKLVLGNKTSNDFFRQLIATGNVKSEGIFYAGTSVTHEPDNILTGNKALEKGECGFTYFLGATISGNPKRPLVAAPMISGTDRFDPKLCNGKAVILKMDRCVVSYPIDKDGHVIVDGKNLMDPQHLIWEGHAPVIAWPD